MEAGDSGGSRQSGPNSATSTSAHPDYYDQRPRDPLDRPYRPPSTAMATAALISPSTPFHSHHSPYSAAYPHPVPAMISPVESNRRASDGETPTHRTSLPSIRDIINGKGQGGPSGPQTLPSPFSSQPNAHPPPPPRRSYAEPPPAREKPPSPRSLHHPASAYSRPEPLPAFADPSRPPAGPPRPGPPQLSIYPAAPPAAKPESVHEIDHRHPGPEGPPHVNGQYPHHAPPPPPPPQHPSQAPPSAHPHAQQSHSPYSAGPPVPLPSGQLPLSAFPMSPRHHGAPSLHSPYSAQRPPLGPEDDYARSRGKYDAQLGRHYEGWNYADALAKIGSSSRQILYFAEMYGKIAQEEQGPPPPGRLPAETEIADMLQNCEQINYMLEMVRGSVIQTVQRMREASRARGFEDDDVNMYNDGMKQGYGSTEVKKRRGRAAPPGRCHSCNRIDTPEWRRGPDGARTLCNACGLHYAKLERKRQMEQRGNRSKNSDDRS